MRKVCFNRSGASAALFKVGGITIMVAALFSGCTKPVAEAPPEAPPEVTTATPVPATPAPATPAPRVVEATPAPNYTAPPGVFFLVAKTSVETPDGITGLRPGTQVQQTGPMEYLAPGGHKLTLRPDQVTNDLRIAQHVAGADTAAQNALRQLYAARPTTSSAPAPTPTPTPRPIVAPPPQRPSTALGNNGMLGSSHSRVKDGFVWEKDSNGVWTRVRPVR